MIKVWMLHCKGEVVGFEISGHSGYAEEGSDIICASVSSCAYMTANTVTEILKLDAKVKISDGYMKFVLANEDAKKAKTLLDGFSMHISSLEEDYGKFVTCKQKLINNNSEVQYNA